MAASVPKSAMMAARAAIEEDLELPKGPLNPLPNLSPYDSLGDEEKQEGGRILFRVGESEEDDYDRLIVFAHSLLDVKVYKRNAMY